MTAMPQYTRQFHSWHQTCQAAEQPVSDLLIIAPFYRAVQACNSYIATGWRHIGERLQTFLWLCMKARKKKHAVEPFHVAFTSTLSSREG